MRPPSESDPWLSFPGVQGVYPGREQGSPLPQIKGVTGKKHMDPKIGHAQSPIRFRFGGGRMGHAGSVDDGDRLGSNHSKALPRTHDDGGILVNPDAQDLGTLGHSREETVDPPSLGEVLVNDGVWEKAHTRGHADIPSPRRVIPPAFHNHGGAHDGRTGGCPADDGPPPMGLLDRLVGGGATQKARNAQLVTAREEDPGGAVHVALNERVAGLDAVLYQEGDHLPGAQFFEDLHVEPCCRLLFTGGRRDEGEDGLSSPGHLHKVAKNPPVTFFVLFPTHDEEPSRSVHAFHFKGIMARGASIHAKQREKRPTAASSQNTLFDSEDPPEAFSGIHLEFNHLGQNVCVAEGDAPGACGFLLDPDHENAGVSLFEDAFPLVDPSPAPVCPEPNPFTDEAVEIPFDVRQNPLGSRTTTPFRLPGDPVDSIGAVRRPVKET